jgi:hypothetical protein
MIQRVSIQSSQGIQSVQRAVESQSVQNSELMPWIVNSEVSQHSGEIAADGSESFSVTEVLLRAVVTNVW